MLTDAATEAKAAVEKSFYKDENYFFVCVVLRSRKCECAKIDYLP